MQFLNTEAENKWARGISAQVDKHGKPEEYGLAIFRYAVRWAELMENEISNGNKIKDVAKELSYEADTEGITGFMYGAAVGLLAACWKYGEELRLWHNLETQIGTEGEQANQTGGVLNPAIINIAKTH